MLYFLLGLLFICIAAASYLVGIWYLVLLMLYEFFAVMFLGIINVFDKPKSKFIEFISNLLVSFIVIFLFFVIAANPLFYNAFFAYQFDLELTLFALIYGLVLYLLFSLVYHILGNYKKNLILNSYNESLRKLFFYLGLFMTIGLYLMILYMPYHFRGTDMTYIYIIFAVVCLPLLLILIVTYYLSELYGKIKMDFFSFTMTYMKILSLFSMFLLAFGFLYSMFGNKNKPMDNDVIRLTRAEMVQEFLNMYYEDNGKYPEGKCVNDLIDEFVPKYYEKWPSVTLDVDENNVVYGTKLGGCEFGDFGYSALKYGGVDGQGYVLIVNTKSGGNFIVGGSGIVNFLPDCAILGEDKCDYSSPYSPELNDAVNTNVFDDVKDLNLSGSIQRFEGVAENKEVYVLVGTGSK